MLDLRILTGDDLQFITRLTIEALFHYDARNRRGAIEELCDYYPVVGAYAHHNRILLYLESSEGLHLGFLCDVPEKYHERNARPFYEPNE